MSVGDPGGAEDTEVRYSSWGDGEEQEDEDEVETQTLSSFCCFG